MVKQLETRFKRIETKYVVSKENLEDLLTDLKEYLVEDDYPTSTISNIYFDTDNFDVIQDALDGNHRQEKIRMRTYLTNPKIDSKVFLEIKAKMMKESVISFVSFQHRLPSLTLSLIHICIIDKDINTAKPLIEIIDHFFNGIVVSKVNSKTSFIFHMAITFLKFVLVSS